MEINDKSLSEPTCNVNTNIIFLDETIISDFKNNINNENLSSISKYFNRGSVKYNENIFYDKNFNPENNKIFVTNDNQDNLLDLKNEIRAMLENIIKFKSKAYSNFKADNINDAMSDYLKVKFFLIILNSYSFFLLIQLKL